MSKSLMFLVIALLLSMMLAASPRPAMACSCNFMPPQKALASADLVFVGRAIDKVHMGNLFSFEDGFAFRVFTIYKGQLTATIAINNEEMSMCRYPFQLNGDYLVYAYKSENGFRTSSCSRTKFMSQGQEDFAALGTGTPIPASMYDDSINTASMFNLLPLAAASITMLFGALVLYQFKRRRNAA